MTSTRRTIPAPPPNGVSSTCPPVSGVKSRGLTQVIDDPASTTLRTWRCSRNQSNHGGKRVKTSMSIRSSALAEEGEVDVDDARLDVDRADRVVDERHEQR